MDELTAANINPNMVDDLVVAADRVEEYEISLAQVALADSLAGRFLIPRTPLQVDADLGVDKLRKR